MDEQTIYQQRKLGGVRLRRFTGADLPQAVELWAGAFGMELPDEDARRSSTERLAFSLVTDPAGSFVAEREGVLIGLAQALQRERLWVLSALAVAQEAREVGLGHRLLERALAYGRRDATRLIVSSNDPRALRLYERMGLRRRPTVQAEGAVPRDLANRASRAVKEGGAADVPALERISREIRGAPHTREILFALERGDARILLAEEAFAVVRPGQGVWLLVAREEGSARALLVASLALAGRCDRPIVRWLSVDQRWAIDELERAGLTVAPYGALFVGGDPGPLRPFIPSGAFA